uniref:Poly [ADP-ribose] polymerase n=1 Tax=Acanthochromis polyacanthus TaxID=80966 RepID=A0A3Q1G734_9TELE
TVTLGGGVKLQVVFGDITNETTDAVVNTTDFINFQTGDSNSRRDVLKTQPGSFPCKAILHVGGEKNAAIVEQLVCSIIQRCESSGYKSVAIPAICAGTTVNPPAVLIDGHQKNCIDRLQNVHLRRTYEAQKKHISDKNRQRGGEREMLLYHGTTKDKCDSIMKNGFNRSFAGQNAAAYGHGTYFAVNASYSAHPTYSKPADDGSQLMFVARVLTGLYTRGQSGMVVPPLVEGSLEDHDRYDSVVDRIDNPSMYVVFHDNQAYPDYLITFH